MGTRNIFRLLICLTPWLPGQLSADTWPLEVRKDPFDYASFHFFPAKAVFPAH